ALHVALGAADDLDHRLARVRRFERALEQAGDAETVQCERLLHAFAQRSGRAGVAAVELAGESAELVERASVVVECPRPPQPLLCSSSPSIIITAKRTSSRRRLINSDSAPRVRSTKLRETDDFDVDRAARSTCEPTGSCVRR